MYTHGIECTLINLKQYDFLELKDIVYTCKVSCHLEMADGDVARLVMKEILITNSMSLTRNLVITETIGLCDVMVVGPRLP